MGKTTEDFTVRGIRIISSTIDVIEGSILWFRLGKMFAPAMVVLRTMPASERIKLARTIAELDLEKLDIGSFGELISVLGPAMGEMFAKADLSDMPSLWRALFQATVIVRDSTKFECAQSIERINAGFDGDQGALWTAAFFVARHNFTSFGFGRLESDDKLSKAASSSTSGT